MGSERYLYYRIGIGIGISILEMMGTEFLMFMFVVVSIKKRRE